MQVILAPRFFTLLLLLFDAALIVTAFYPKWPLVGATTEQGNFMPVITLPDGSQRLFDAPVTIHDVAFDIGPGLA